MLAHEVLDKAAGGCEVIVLIRRGDVFHQGIQPGEYPSVDFRPFGEGDLGGGRIVFVDICVQREERVRVVQGAEELAANLVHAGLVELEVVPGLGVGEHVPAKGIGPISIQSPERIHGVAEPLGHLVAVLVQHKAVGNHPLERGSAANHGVDCVQGVEPSARLVHAFRDEICRGAEIRASEIAEAFLCVRHCAGIEPYVDKVALANHLAAAVRHKEDIVHIRPVKIDEIIVLQGHVLRIEAFVLQGVGGHDAGLDGLLDLVVKLIYRADAFFLPAVFSAPDGQRSAPVAAAAEVPVLDVLQPHSEAAGAGACGLPGDLLVQLNHLVFHRRCLDEPGIQRVVQHRKVRAPAVRVVVHVLLHPERAAIRLHHNAKVDVQRTFLIFFLEVFLVTGLYISACIFLVRRIHRCGIGRIQVFQAEEAALTVHLGLWIAILVDGHDSHDACGCGNALIVGTKSGGDVHDTGTVRRGNIISGNHAEGISLRLEPGDELVIADPNQFRALETAFQHLPGDDFIALLVAFKRKVFSLFLEPCAHKILCKDVHCRLAGIWIEGKDPNVFDIRANAKRRV